jgi:hypothetical protein
MSTQTLYSNGYRVDDVMTSLMNRTRWRQPTRSDFGFVLSGNNVWSSGDNYSPVFEAIHKAVTPYNILVTQEDSDITQTQFNDYLQNLQKDAILKCLKGVLNKSEMLENKLMFERFGRQDYINLNTGVFVGVRIKPAKKFDVTCQIDNVTLLFDSDVTFNMYLFHDSQPLIPVLTIPVTALANQQKVVNVTKYLSYAGDAHKSGCYYFGYFQNDLGGAHGINEIIQQFNECYNFGLVPVELQTTGGTTINVNNVSFTIKSHGFNIQLSAFRDFTQLIVDNAYLFDNLIGLQVAADVIEMIQNTLRTNKDERVMQDLTKQLSLDLNIATPTQDLPFSIGLKQRIQVEAARVKQELYPVKRITAVTHDTENSNIYGMSPSIIDALTY